MRTTHVVGIAVLVSFLHLGCDRQDPAAAGRIAELERQAAEAAERQAELELQVEEQKLAAERDAIERERMQIEEARAELERQQDETAAAEAEKIRLREEELAKREGRVEEIQASMELKEQELQKQREQLAEFDQQLSERDREIAGREAIAINEEPVESVPVADYGMFHDSLSAYGSWFETPDYGYVWQPVVVRESSWRPYTRGRWACTDHGWTWISDEPFGWATYHYGRWALLRGRGWIWIPGTEWAPSWVSWRSSGSHIGWAPLPPETLAYRSHRWDHTVDVTFGIGSAWFSFVETRYFGQPAHRYCLPVTRNDYCYGSTVNITYIHVHNNRVICGGPSYRDVSRQVIRPLPFYRLEQDHYGRPGRDPLAMRPRVEEGRLRVAAPRMDVAWNDGLRPARVKGRIDTVAVERSSELRPEVSERFRKTREENRSRANQSITELGGPGHFAQRRQEQLEANRRVAAENARRIEESRDRASRPGTTKPSLTSTRPGTIPPNAANPPKATSTPPKPSAGPKPAPREETPAGTRPSGPTKPAAVPPTTGVPPKATPAPPKPSAGPKPAPREETPAGTRPSVPTKPAAVPPTTGAPPKATPTPPKPSADPKPAPRPAAPTQRPTEQDRPSTRPQSPAAPSSRPAAPPPARVVRPIPPTHTPSTPGRISPPVQRPQTEKRIEPPATNRAPLPPSPSSRELMQARQQQMEAQRQQQARQQQMEAQRQQQARQQQMEAQRQQQARQQQMEAQRQQQVRQQQMEAQRQQQARQQQMEAQRQQEARQQQMEAQRQQQARQQQVESDRSRNNRTEEERFRRGR